MTTPSDPSGAQPGDPSGEPRQPIPGVDFDPYRFGAPEQPIAPEWAPLGYAPPVPPPPAYGPPPAPQLPPYPGQQPPPYPGQPGQPGYGGYQDPYSAQDPYGGQPPYGPPPGYPYAPYPQPGTGAGGKAITALVMGILSIVLFWTSFFDAVFVILALVFGFITIGEAKSRPGRSGHGFGVAGVVCALVGLVAAAIFTVWIVHVSNQCGSGFYDGGTSWYCN